MAWRSGKLLCLLGGFARAAAEACPGSQNSLLSVVTSLSPECFEACPQICGPLEELIGEYMATSDTDSIKVKVCGAQEQFGCMFEEHQAAACLSVLSAGSMIGIELPLSREQLSTECTTVHDGDAGTDQEAAPTTTQTATTATLPATTVAQDSTSTTIVTTTTQLPATTTTEAAGPVCAGASNPLISVVTDLSPGCFQSCPQVCLPLDNLVTMYLAGVGEDVLKEIICADIETFTCMLGAESFGACQRVLEAGSLIGVSLPMSHEEVQTRCGLTTTATPAVAESAAGSGASSGPGSSDASTSPSPDARGGGDGEGSQHKDHNSGDAGTAAGDDTDASSIHHHAVISAATGLCRAGSLLAVAGLGVATMAW